MKILIEAPDGTKEDIIEFGKFLAEYWKERKDVVAVTIIKGTKTMSKEEVNSMIREIFRGRKHWTKVFEMHKG
jgi:ribosome maturation protein Sdo1